MSTPRKPMVGKRFGRLTVVATAPDKNWRGTPLAMYRCVCDCGKSRDILGMSLRNGDTTSCGCVLSETCRKKGIAGFKDLAGRKFNSLLVLRRLEPDGKNARFLCRCDCGSETTALGNQLQRGGKKTCYGPIHRIQATPEEKIATQRRNNANRHAAKKMATRPFDVELFNLVEREVYLQAVIMSKCTGIKHEVDHTIPLKSRLVSGLHNEFNLRVFPSVLNRRKKNRYWPDMPGVGA